MIFFFKGKVILWVFYMFWSLMMLSFVYGEVVINIIIIISYEEMLFEVIIENIGSKYLDVEVLLLEGEKEVKVCVIIKFFFLKGVIIGCLVLKIIILVCL